jgi:hypothetical protein
MYQLVRPSADPVSPSGEAGGTGEEGSSPMLHPRGTPRSGARTAGGKAVPLVLRALSGLCSRSVMRAG